MSYHIFKAYHAFDILQHPHLINFRLSSQPWLTSEPNSLPLNNHVCFVFLPIPWFSLKLLSWLGHQLNTHKPYLKKKLTYFILKHWFWNIKELCETKFWIRKQINNLLFKCCHLVAKDSNQKNRPLLEKIGKTPTALITWFASKD